MYEKLHHGEYVTYRGHRNVLDRSKLEGRCQNFDCTVSRGSIFRYPRHCQATHSATWSCPACHSHCCFRIITRVALANILANARSWRGCPREVLFANRQRLGPFCIRPLARPLRELRQPAAGAPRSLLGPSAQGSAFRVYGLVCRVEGFGFRVCHDAPGFAENGQRIPSFTFLFGFFFVFGYHLNKPINSHPATHAIFPQKRKRKRKRKITRKKKEKRKKSKKRGKNKEEKKEKKKKTKKKKIHPKKRKKRGNAGRTCLMIV